MKVVFVSQALAHRFGGAAVSEASLCASLQTHCRIEVLCRAGALDPSFVRGFGLTDVKELHPFEVVTFLRDRRHWLNRTLEDCDLLHVNGHWRWENILLARICHRRGIPFVFQPRGMLWLGERKRYLKKIFNAVWGNWMVRHASKMIALSQFEIEQWAEYPLARNKCEVIVNGVFQPKELSKRFKKGDYFLYLGRIETRKNLPFLLNAYSRYVKDGGAAQLLLVGPVERNHDRTLRRLIAKEKLQTRVQIREGIYGEEKNGLLREAIAVVYPSQGEPFGRVPFETIVAGGVPLVPKESGSAEYLQPFLPDCLFSLKDSDSLVACMRSVEHGRIDGIEQGLKHARSWIESFLSWSRVCDHVLTVYRHVLAESPSQLVWMRGEGALPEMSDVGSVGE